MKRQDLKEKLREKIEGFSTARILVLGDMMLDQFVWGEVSRISPEAPVPVVQVEKESYLLGGAANVANNLKSLDAMVVVSGVIGTDSYGQLLKDLCSNNHIDTDGLIEDNTRPTTLKTRIIARGQQVVRVDRERSGPLSGDTLAQLRKKILVLMESCDAVVVSDYNKGVVSGLILKSVANKAKDLSIPVFLDPKPANASCYQGVSVITPNKKEAEELSDMKINTEKDVEACAMYLAAKMDLDAVLITRGPEGMDLWQRGKGMFSIPTMAREVFDVTGAGDTVISLFALGVVCGLSYCEAAYLANIAAGIVVGKVGTATVTKKELLNALNSAPDIPIKAT